MAEYCQFCQKQVQERRGGVTILGRGDNLMDFLSAALARKFVCPSCGAVFCLDCGNNKGHQLNTGSTHCPRCGTKVL